MNTKQIIKKLTKTFSMYAIAKKLNVTANTVLAWNKGTWEANEENMGKLNNLLGEVKQ